jgi:biotin carboxylase
MKVEPIIDIDINVIFYMLHELAVAEAKKVANKLGYPVLVRPSYVLGGQGMAIAYDDREIEEYVNEINTIEQEHPILVDKYILGREVEVDAICDGKDILIPGIMEHLERAGVHSGDSISVYPTQNVTKAQEQKIIEYTLGASMMEPDFRIITNELGFCEYHTSMLIKQENKLSKDLYEKASFFYCTFLSAIWLFLF